MKPTINFAETDDERGRRNAAKQGMAYTQSADAARRWKARKAADERWARELGEPVTYRSLR